MKRLAVLLSAVSLFGVLGAMQPKQPEKPANVPAGHPQITIPKIGENWPTAKPEDVDSVDAIIKAFYDAPAGAPGQPRDWGRFLSLFVPDARLIAARPGPEGSSGAMFLPAPDYVEANKTYFEKGGFRDTEIGRRVETFGNMVHVWSTYESRRKADDPAPYIRGINSLQLLKDGKRYWIVNAYWDYEREDNPLPEKYVGMPKE
ncbi:hypothetical protein PHYC_00728 [Phycisphaerales bacterium]|nr:hypothetical protein PHYC_00728 [Phycisphaerales bacterium]